MPEIILNHVTKRFGKFCAVDDLNLRVEDNAFISLLGPSGCGKTTTLRMIAGLETPTDGEIIIGGETVFSAEKGIDVPPNKRDVGFLFQNYALWPHMTVYQNIAFGLQNLKWEPRRIRERVAELLKTLRIEEFEKRYPSELSGGQQQRVAIARTLAPNPKVLFMDEPLSNLDAKLRMEMRTELKRLHKTTGATFVYVTHDQLEAMTLSTMVCLMEKGILQQYAPPLKMYAHPANLFVADFVGNPAMNFLDADATAEGENLRIRGHGLDMLFTPAEPTAFRGGPVKLGVRAEHLTPADDGLGGKIYSTLPSGMETIVKVDVGGNLLTSVIFGEVDYPIDTPVHLRFKGDRIALFDETGKRVASGSLT